MAKDKFTPKICQCCGQTETYLMCVDTGTCDIVRAISVAIRKKKKNCVHPRREMELGKNQLNYSQMIREGYLTSVMVGNLSKARSQGLIARVDGKPGYYCLTHKGAEFMKGASIPKYAIMDKVTGHNIGYWYENEERVTMRSLVKSGDYWEINFDIVDKAVVFNLPRTMAFNF